MRKKILKISYGVVRSRKRTDNTMAKSKRTNNDLQSISRTTKAIIVGNVRYDTLHPISIGQFI